MSKHVASSSTSYGVGLGGWLALALFLIWLGWVLFSTSPIEGKAEKPSLPGVAQSDPGTVLDTLPAKGSLTTPNMPFTASQEYVLTGAGVQGFYQTSAPNDVWTLSYPEPQLNAQVIKRAARVPIAGRRRWELGPQAGLAKDSTTRQTDERWRIPFSRRRFPWRRQRRRCAQPVSVIALRAKDEKDRNPPKAPPCWLFPASAVPVPRERRRPFGSTAATSPPTLWNSTRKVRSVPADPAMSV
ncbi:MAG: hypothetical protein ACLSAH_12125 [Bilophila wadsworthia]